MARIGIAVGTLWSAICACGHPWRIAVWIAVILTVIFLVSAKLRTASASIARTIWLAICPWCQQYGQFWRVPLWLAVLGGVAFFVHSGFIYWGLHPGLSWQECAFRDAGCSTAAATWTLATFAVLSAALALEAVVWAIRAYRIEVAPSLGQSRCPKHDLKDHPADKEVFLTEEGLVIQLRPLGFKPEAADRSYFRYDAAFTNLSRTALPEVRVSLFLEDPTGKVSPPVDVEIGNIRCDDEIHVTFYSSKAFLPVQVAWDNATSHGKAIPFFPADRLMKKTVRELDLSSYSLAPLPGHSAGIEKKAPTTHNENVQNAAQPAPEQK